MSTIGSDNSHHHATQVLFFQEKRKIACIETLFKEMRDEDVDSAGFNDADAGHCDRQ
ncbi:hypothetical protein EMIT0357P_60365 [Pseudomonas marginalis]